MCRSVTDKLSGQKKSDRCIVLSHKRHGTEKVMKRKIVAVFLCGSILLSAASCGNREQHAVSKTESNTETTEISPETTEQPRQTTETTEQPRQTAENDGTEQPTAEAAETEAVKFVDYLTENGSGIAREVQPAYGIKEFYAKQRDGSDLRWYDCSLLSEQEETELLENPLEIAFNEDTVFTEALEQALQPELLMENGKNPGLGVRQLHEEGINGSGVGIAIIDQRLYTGHPEYASKIKLYEEMNILPEGEATMHAAALASISVGEECGVAPGADLYFWAYNNLKSESLNNDSYEETDINYAGYAKVIDRILEVNENLPENEKIRVIAISKGYDYSGNSYGVRAEIRELLEAVRRAEEAGIFVVTTSTGKNYSFFSPEQKKAPFAGLAKIDPAGDMEDAENYTLGFWQWENAQNYEQSVLIPMDNRTTADFTGDTYVYYIDGGWSWTVPYIAGVYALCAQVREDITPELFYEAAWETSTEIVRNQEEGGREYTFHVINPWGMIEYLEH